MSVIVALGNDPPIASNTNSLIDESANQPDTKSVTHQSANPLINESTNKEIDPAIPQSADVIRDLVLALLPKPVINRESVDQVSETVLNLLTHQVERESLKYIIDGLKHGIRPSDIPEDWPWPVNAQTVPDERLEWLWTGEIPIGQMTMLDGPGSVGKSCIVVDIAARLSRAEAMPGDNSVRGFERSLIIAAEDDLAVLRGRLKAAGARMEFVDLLPDPILLPSQAAKLRAICEYGRYRFVACDPIVSCFDSGLSANVELDVRSVLSPLRTIARDLRLAVVLLRHLNKNAKTNEATLRGMGSVAFSNYCRSNLFVWGGFNGKFETIMRQIKTNNSGTKGKRWPYSIEGVELEHGSFPRVVWGQPIENGAFPDEPGIEKTKKSKAKKTKPKAKKTKPKASVDQEASVDQPDQDVDQCLASFLAILNDSEASKECPAVAQVLNGQFGEATRKLAMAKAKSQGLATTKKTSGDVREWIKLAPVSLDSFFLHDQPGESQ